MDELTHFLNSTQLPAASQQVEVIEDDSEDETIEELYCTLPTSVVGVRYYEGERTIIITLISDILGERTRRTWGRSGVEERTPQ